MLSKSEFIEIINRLKSTNETKSKVNEIIKECTDAVVNDFVEVR